MTKDISKEIQRPYGQALGDCWSVLNYFISLGLEKDEIIRLSLWYPKGNSKKRADKLKEILPLLENDNIIHLGEWEPTSPKIHWTCGHIYPPVSTQIKWKPNQSKKICYQFDGRSKQAKNFPSKESENKVLNAAQDNGYKVIRLGEGMTLKECVTIASGCEIFLGIDSGMCYLAAAVGIPIFFCKNNRPHAIWESMNHSNKHFILTNNYIELINVFNKYVENGINYYVENASNISLFWGKS